MATYETTSYAQMRRCRMAHLYGRMIDERFEASDEIFDSELSDSDISDFVHVGGYVHAVRPDLTCWPLRWTITVETYPVSARALAMAG